MIHLFDAEPEEYLIKNKAPVMISFVNLKKWAGYNVVIYVWNSKTGKYLIHYGWPDGRNS
ncbi:hypothetical protein [Mycoplasmopsis gallinacea]|uniref:Uncharacterized protein n=1 Tax=Mycoplasmopsis gallinacea TaxID=29556 RepID=A0A6H0V208_9BACT|nr:hypothetical protein [Mycoplasmopsis gallinacea]QIW62008.1 hypothetical protein GOQ20_00800 [Mycoplasmopsis gallinacea]